MRANAHEIRRDPALHAETCAWLRAHGIDPAVVWSVRTFGPLTRIREFRTNEHGRFLPRGRDRFAMRARWRVM